ncbi:MAG: hypothetical protein IT306_31210 [Chloroflexi bacterium]|nr:hypothetical protein [Chloroflexota bacterium]
MAPRKPRRHAGEHDLIEAFGQPGCPVCRLATEAVDAYLTSVCYEQVNDLDLRAQLRTAGGFCRPHAERFIRQRLGQLAAAIVYRDVLNTARKRLAAGGWGGRGRSMLSGWFGRAKSAARGLPPCPGCEVEAEAEGRYLAALRNRLREPSVREKYQAGDGLCLPHIDQALETDDAGAETLASASVEMLGTIVEQLDEYIKKHDYRFHNPVWDGGEDTPERAVERAVGHRPPPEFVS